MIDEELNEIKKVDKHHRLGQAICNSLDITNSKLYYIKDHELLNLIKKYKEMIFNVTNKTGEDK